MDAQTVFEIVIAVLSLANIFVTLTVRNEILKVKLWAKDEFVSREEWSASVDYLHDRRRSG